MDDFIPPLEDLQYGPRRMNDAVLWYRADAVEAALTKALADGGPQSPEVPRSRREVGVLGRSRRVREGYQE
jgi:hypothetical protein